MKKKFEIGRKKYKTNVIIFINKYNQINVQRNKQHTITLNLTCTTTITTTNTVIATNNSLSCIYNSV